MPRGLRRRAAGAVVLARLPPRVPEGVGGALEVEELPHLPQSALRRRRIFDGANLYRGECATKVQAAWRGCASRAATEPLLRATNPRLRRKFAERQLGQMTDALVAAAPPAAPRSTSSSPRLSRRWRRAAASSAPPPTRPSSTPSGRMPSGARDRGLDSGCAICLASFGAGERLALLLLARLPRALPHLVRDVCADARRVPLPGVPPVALHQGGDQRGEGRAAARALARQGRRRRGGGCAASRASPSRRHSRRRCPDAAADVPAGALALSHARAAAGGGEVS